MSGFAIEFNEVSSSTIKAPRAFLRAFTFSRTFSKCQEVSAFSVLFFQLLDQLFEFGRHINSLRPEILNSFLCRRVNSERYGRVSFCADWGRLSSSPFSLSSATHGLSPLHTTRRLRNTSVLRCRSRRRHLFCSHQRRVQRHRSCTRSSGWRRSRSRCSVLLH